MISDKKAMEYAEKLKEYCFNHVGCKDCIFDVVIVNPNYSTCVLRQKAPCSWRTRDLIKE